MDWVAVAAAAAGIVFLGSISKYAERLYITPPLLFTLYGFLICNALLGVIQIEADAPNIHKLAEFTLVIVLFSDASRIDLRVLTRDRELPLRLLLIGLPLTMLLGTLVALVLFDYVGMWEAALLAAILAPTDAALGQAVVVNPRVPVRIRQTLNVESGLNDGLVTPFVFFFLAAAVGMDTTGSFSVRDVLQPLVIGMVVGVAVGMAGGWWIKVAYRRGIVDKIRGDICVLALAILTFAIAEWMGSNGFIASFCAGAAYGQATGHSLRTFQEFVEAQGDLLTATTFIVFGGVLLPEVFQHFSWQAVIYAALSLTVVRMLPVAISLIGSRLHWPSYLFLGWFGPRGLASIVFALVAVENEHLIGREAIVATIGLTVFFSVIAHGLTSIPGANWYARHAEAMDATAPENQMCRESPMRTRGSIAGATDDG